MKLILLSIRESRAAKSKEMQSLVDLYVARAAKYLSCEIHVVATEPAFWAWAERVAKSPPQTILLDAQGELLTSEQIATSLGYLRDTGTALLVLAIGPASGWSAASLARAHRTLSLGRITLPHELARVVLAEQVYRALTILAGHPYHSGH